MAEIAIALVLLIGAGLLVRSFARLTAVDPGFRPQNILTFRLALPGTQYPEDHRRVRFYQELQARLTALSDVQAAGGIAFLPFAGPGSATSFTIEGRPDPPRGERPVADVRWITGDYLRAMGIPLVAGRRFDARDTGEASRVVLVSETLARLYWPDDPTAAIGERLAISWDEGIVDEIVGIVADVRHAGFAVDPRPMIYWPHPRVPAGFMTMVVKTRGDPIQASGAIVTQVRALDPDLPVAAVRPLESVVRGSVAGPRLTMWLLGTFAAIATLLGAVGIYGVLAYSVTERGHEIGVRIALGADRARVLRLVVREGLGLTLLGSALGVAGALGLTRLMESQLFGVTPTDPATFAALVVVIALVAVTASLLPALRATRVDPMVAIRTQ